MERSSYRKLNTRFSAADLAVKKRDYSNLVELHSDEMAEVIPLLIDDPVKQMEAYHTVQILRHME